MNQEAVTTPVNKFTKPQSKGFLFGMEAWEVILIAISVFLITVIALPNYFSSLSWRRGQECSRRLQLLANSLTYLAVKNQTPPGGKICEPLELNQALDLAQGALKIEGNLAYIPAFFRYGTKPDCSDGGDMIVNFFLDENGKIVPPTCTRYHEIGEDYCTENGMHLCDMSIVDGNIMKEQEEVFATPTEIVPALDGVLPAENQETVLQQDTEPVIETGLETELNTESAEISPDEAVTPNGSE